MGTPYNSRYVGGEGPDGARLMLIGEGPGKDEDRHGRPFVGKSGVELWRYLWRSCHLMRDDVYVTNLVKYHVPDDEDPTPEDIRRDAPELECEISRVNPEFIASLGWHSTRHLLGDVDMDAVHGVAHLRSGRVILPIIHPAAGLHNTEFQAKIWWDFERLAELFSERGTGMEAVDGYKRPQYGPLALTARKGLVVPGPTAVDTEGSVSRPWCLTFTHVPGKAAMVRQPGRISRFEHAILHNSMHDLGVLRAMGVEIDQFDDTMIKAYELGVEPQGLKNLARRHCGMSMQEYSEVLGDAQRKHNERWLFNLLNNAYGESPATTGKKGRKAATSASAGKRSAKTCRKTPKN